MGALSITWREESLRLRPAAEALELPLRQSPRLRLARPLFAVAILLYALELLVTGHWIATLAVLSLAPVFGLRRRTACAAPDKLVLAADGQLLLGFGEGRLEPMRLQPQSLALGSHLLLVLRGASSTVRLLLGPDNMASADLAALKRRLPSGAAQASGVHSVAASGSKPSDLS